MASVANYSNLVGSTLRWRNTQLLVEREIGDQQFVIEDLTNRCTFKVRDEKTGELRFATSDFFTKGFGRGLEIVSDASGRIKTPVALPQMDHEQIIAKDKGALKRWTTVRALAEAGSIGTDRELAVAINRIWTPQMVEEFGDKPKLATVRLWLRRGDPATITLAEMMSRTGRVRRKPRLPPELKRLLKEEALKFYASYGTLQIDVRASVSSAVTVRNEERAQAGLPPLPMPCAETIRQAIKQEECFDTTASKYGRKAAKNRWALTGRSFEASRIMESCFMDDHEFDTLLVVDLDRHCVAGTPQTCTLMDGHSKCVFGEQISFDPPSASKAAATIRDAGLSKIVRADRLEKYPILEHICGHPNQIVHDLGTNYMHLSFQRILADLDISVVQARVSTPTDKGPLERYYSTVRSMIIRKLPGSRVTVELRREMGLNPEATAVLSLSEFKEILEEAKYVYHMTDHSELGMPPALKWQESYNIWGPRILSSAHRLDVLTMLTVRGRSMRGGRIKLHNLEYCDRDGSASLNDNMVRQEPVRSRPACNKAKATVDIKYDPTDLGRILVRNQATLATLANGSTPIEDEWVVLPCTHQAYAAGLSLYEHQQIRAWTKKRARRFISEADQLAARHDLNQLVRKLAPDMDKRERRAAARLLEGKQTLPPEYALVEAVDEPPREIVEVTLAQTEPRFDGMGPIVPITLRGADREDANIKRTRPNRKSTAASQTKEDDEPEEDVELSEVLGEPEWSAADDDDDLDADFEEYL